MRKRRREQIATQETLNKYELQKNELEKIEARIELMRLRLNECQTEEELYKMNTGKLGRLYDRGVIDSDGEPKLNSE